MIQASNISTSLDALLPENGELFRREVARALGVKASALEEARLLKRSIDARKKSNVHGVVTVAVQLAKGAKVRPAKGVTAKPYELPEPLRIPWVGGSALDSDRPDAAFEFAPTASHPPCGAAGAESKDSVVLDRPQRPVVVGTGPAGLFCALYLARAGLRPLVVERGAAVDERVEIIEAFNNGAPLDTCTNIQFGEGGAGTFSDGKLNTGIKSPHIRHVLEAFVEAGAPEDILVDAKPHIGTDLLVGVVRNLRCAIEEAGGEVRFLTRLDGLEVAADEDGGASGRSALDTLSKGVGTAGSASSTSTAAHPHVTAAVLVDERTGATEVVPTDCVVLACGHSARDTFAMARDAGVTMERKPFAVGVRIEHPQQQVNAMQYGAAAGHPALGAADYKLAVKCADGRGVYTFCMCPGGEVVAAASEEGGLCVNGMSRHARAGANANSALLVEVRPDDLPGDDPLEGVRFQRQLEQNAYQLGGSTYVAPVQAVGSFLSGTAGAPSATVEPTYPRGVAWSNLRECLPAFVADSLAEGLPLLDRKLHGFADPQAVMTAVEARSSSPVRMVRDGVFQSSIAGLYPCGEGAGYAGGITSAAVDGLRVAESIVANLAEEVGGAKADDLPDAYA